MEIIAKHQQLDCDMRKKIEDIELSISIREIANNYFHKSASWLYHKLDGIDGNGGKKKKLLRMLYLIFQTELEKLLKTFKNITTHR